jgi:hypothetical protein
MSGWPGMDQVSVTLRHYFPLLGLKPRCQDVAPDPSFAFDSGLRPLISPAGKISPLNQGRRPPRTVPALIRPRVQG